MVVMREMQMKSTTAFHFIPIRLSTKCLTRPSDRQYDAEQWGILRPAGKNMHWFKYFR